MKFKVIDTKTWTPSLETDIFEYMVVLCQKEGNRWLGDLVIGSNEYEETKADFYNHLMFFPESAYDDFEKVKGVLSFIDELKTILERRKI